MDYKSVLMYNHASHNYNCPICLAVQGIESDDTMIKQADIFYRDELVLGFIGSKFIKGHEGYPLLVPVNHIENIYDLPINYGHRIMDMARDLSIALKLLRKCDGVKVIQNNEPAAGQHAFHYHLHIIPRFEGLEYNDKSEAIRVSRPEERIMYAQQLKEYFASAVARR